LIYTTGRAMAQAVSRQPLTPETGVRARVRACRICGGESGTRTVFLRVLRFSPIKHYCTVAVHAHITYVLVAIVQRPRLIPST
jgi:hypothetical protein